MSAFTHFQVPFIYPQINSLGLIPDISTVTPVSSFPSMQIAIGTDDNQDWYFLLQATADVTQEIFYISTVGKPSVPHIAINKFSNRPASRSPA
jgi:hypothetical protein